MEFKYLDAVRVNVSVSVESWESVMQRGREKTNDLVTKYETKLRKLKVGYHGYVIITQHLIIWKMDF